MSETQQIQQTDTGLPSPPLAQTFGNNRQNAEPAGFDFADPMDLIGDMGFLDAFPGPQILKIDGQKFEVAPWSTDDYIPWLEELTGVMRSTRLAEIPREATPLERYQIKMNVQETEITPDDMMGQVFRPKVTKRIIVEAMTRSGIDKAKAEAWYKKRPARANEMLGLLLSGLYTVDQFNRTYRKLLMTVEKPVESAPAAETPGAPGRSPTFGENRRPLAPNAGNSPVSGSSEQNGDSLIGQQSESKSSRQPAEAPVA